MPHRMRSAGYITGTALFFGAVLATPVSALAANPAQSATKHVGNSTITVKLLPAETFTRVVSPSTRGEMDVLGGPGHPVPASKANYHLVVFIRHDGQPVTDAKVNIRYRLETHRHAAWRKVSVVRMDVAGKGISTTHYGNNVLLKPGKYDINVEVNNNLTKHFEFDVG